MNTNRQTSKEYFKSLTIAHAALIMGQLLFAGVIYFQVSSAGNSISDRNGIPFDIIVPILVIGGIVASYFIFNTLLKSAKNKSNLKEKLVSYRSAMIVRFALLEGPSLFSIIIVMITGNIMFFIYTLLIIGFFLYYRPTKESITNELELNFEEKSVINNPESIFS